MTFVIAMVTPALGERVTRGQVVRRTTALVVPLIVDRGAHVTQVQEDLSIPVPVALHMADLGGQNTMDLVDQLTTAPVARLMLALEVPVTQDQEAPAIPALVGMVIVAQPYANSSRFGFKRNVKTDMPVKGGEQTWHIPFATIHVR
jgi:hypothetical protein